MTRPDPIRRTPVHLARLVLVWERAAPVLAAPLAGLALYLALALFGVFERIGDPWRALTALLIASLAGLVTLRPARAFAWPTRREAERRVEADNALKDREYESLADARSTGDEGLWAAHRQRMAERLARVRTRRPRAAWATLDPYGLRISALLVLAAGVFLAGNLASLRVQDAFALRLLAGGGERALVDLWIEPPAYTGVPTLYLRDRRSADIPVGSQLAARISGLRRAPRVTGGEAVTESLGDDSWQIRVPITAAGTISLRAGALNETVRLTVIPDTPPRMALAAEPEGDAEGRLLIEYAAADDYGVETVSLEIAPEPELRGGSVDEALWERIAIAPRDITSRGRDDLYSASLDLARHRLAGERVQIRVAGTDGAGQTGISAPIEITLPERVFLDPLARAVAFERKGLLREDGAYAPVPDTVGDAEVETSLDALRYLDDQPSLRIERAPPGVQRLALALDAISDAPSGYFDDAIVYFGLRTAMQEVRRARAIEALDHLDEDLWKIALRAELGTLADARAALEAAQQALMDAMARGADAMELGPLFDAYEQAMQNYMAALMREAIAEGEMAGGGGGGGANMNGDRLQELLDALREAAELGDTENARRAMQQLMALLRNMQIQLGSGSGQGQSEMSRALQEALEELGDMIGEQRELMEDTFREPSAPPQAGGQPQPGQSQPGQPTPLPQPGIGPIERDPPQGGQPGGAQTGPEDRPGGAGASPDPADQQAMADRQAELEQRLRELAGRMPGGEGEEALARAGDAMDDAAEALRRGENGAALEAQDEALDAMREGAADAAERLLAEEQGDGSGQGQTDPLGRANGTLPGGSVDLPSQSERQRAREILEELRRRAAERGRPREELDYIERLLERF